MSYGRYIGFCIAGAVLWVGGVITLGYLFGGIPIIKNNFEIVILGIIFVSVLPIIWQVIKGRGQAKQA